MNNFIHAVNGSYTNDIYYTSTESLFIKNKHWDKLDKAELVGKKYYKIKMIIKRVGSSLDCS